MNTIALMHIVKQLAKLAEGLENGNSSAEYKAAQLARQAAALVETMEKADA